MNKIIQHLRDARQERRLTQADFGRKLGLPQSHISKIEKGLTNPRLSTITEMARLLDQELVLVPRAMLPAVKAVFLDDVPQKPRWQPDEED